MFDISEDIHNPKLFTHFGTSSPHWTLAADSHCLQLSSQKDDAGAVGVPLTPAQSALVRKMSGANSSLVLDVTIFGSPMRMHLVGRQTDASAWGGTAANYGDTATVTKDLESGMSFAEQIVQEVNSLVIIIDCAGRIQRFNKLCEETTGMLEADLLGKNAHALFIPEDVRDQSWEAISEFFKRGTAYEVMRPIQTSRGVRMIHWRNVIMRSGSGPDQAYLVCSGTDATTTGFTRQNWMATACSRGSTGTMFD